MQQTHRKLAQGFALIVIVIALFVAIKHEMASKEVPPSTHATESYATQLGNSRSAFSSQNAQVGKKRAIKDDLIYAKIKELCEAGNGTELIRYLQTLDHYSDIDALWDNLREQNFSDTLKRGLNQELIRMLASTMTFVDLQQYVFEKVGAGTDRVAAIGSMIMHSSPTLNDYLTLTEKLSNSDELSYAAVKYGSKLARDRAAAKQNVDQLMRSGESGKAAAVELLKLLPTSIHNEPYEAYEDRMKEALEIANDLASKKLLSSKDLSYLFDAYGTTFTYKLFEFTQNEKFKSLFTNDDIRLLSEKMAHKNSTLYLEELLKTNFDGSLSIGIGLKYALLSDSAKALAWLEKNTAKMPPKVKDDVSKSLAVHYSQQTDYNKAWEQVAQITDPAIKKQAEGQVWAKERNMVQNAVKAEPQKVIEELVSAQSKHDSYWIEEAMDVWLKKDFESAEQWYQQNWKTLPKEKAQYVAASFARQAIQAGDIDAALQWVSYIQDVKTKARIEAQLEKVQKLQ